MPQVLSKTVDGTSTYYIYGLGLIAEETGADYKTYHFDQRGSTTAITNSTGLVTDTYDYGPYGELLSHSGTSQVDYMYNGRDGVVTDSEDLYYMRARYYSTDLRRFLSEDNYTGKYDNILGMNLYGYVNGNPVQYVDPSGNAAYSTNLSTKSFEFLMIAVVMVEAQLFSSTYDILDKTGVNNLLSQSNETDSSSSMGSPQDPNNNKKKNPLKDIIERLLSKSESKTLQWTGKNFKQISKTMSPEDMINDLESAGWNKVVEKGGNKSGPATILTDPNTGMKVRIHAQPGEGTPYFRVQNKGGGYLDDAGVFPSNATKQALRDLTHFYFEK